MGSSGWLIAAEAWPRHPPQTRGQPSTWKAVWWVGVRWLLWRPGRSSGAGDSTSKGHWGVTWNTPLQSHIYSWLTCSVSCICCTGSKPKILVKTCEQRGHTHTHRPKTHQRPLNFWTSAMVELPPQPIQNNWLTPSTVTERFSTSHLLSTVPSLLTYSSHIQALQFSFLDERWNIFTDQV